MDITCEKECLISEEQKSVIRGMAKTVGLSVDDFLWQAALAFKSKSERHAIAALLHELEHTADKTCANIDATIAYIDASNKRIAEMEAKARREF